MSSQGPSSGSRSTPTGANGCYGPTGPSQVPVGYIFNTLSIRDGSDWTSYKKQTVILNEDKAAGFQDPWFVYGNESRLQFLQGQYKCPSESCSGPFIGRVIGLPNLT